MSEIEKAISVLKELKDTGREKIEVVRGTCYAYIEIAPVLSVLEAQQADMWIPMSSGKLSDSIGETVLLTVKTDRGISHGNGSIDIAYLRNNEKRIFYGTTEQYSFDDVIAWKLLPTPYKEDV